MYAIEAKNEKGRPWISGIFKERADAERYYWTIPTELRNLQSVVEIPVSSYPFFVTENDGFEYLGITGLEAALEALQSTGDEDAVLLNIYVITDDYFSPEPGADNMGALYHTHITDEPPKGKPRTAVLQELLRAANI